MKRIVFIYMTVLIVVFAALSALDRKSDYIVEKKVWAIYQQQLDIANDPNVIPEKSFERVLDRYRKVIERYPHSRLTPGIRIHVGEMYALKKDYAQARQVFQEVIALYPDNREVIAESMFKIGKTYEATDDWPAAYDMYKKIIMDYPLTGVSLNTPLYIANYYKSKNDFQNTMNAYEFAIRHYKNIASTNDNSHTGLKALRRLANCYLDQRRWGEAVETLALILEKYSTSNYLSVRTVESIIKTINITAAYEIHDYDAAIKLYQGIIDRNPRHPLDDYLQKVIDAFNQLKEKGINVSER